MMKFRFFSDSNLSGFVQSIANGGFEVESDEAKQTVTVLSEDDWVRDLAAQWGGIEE